MKHSRLPGPLYLLFIVSGVAIASCSNSSNTTEHHGEGISVEEILQKNLRAVRPDSPFDKIENREIVIQISEAAVTLLARYRASADGHMRIDVFNDDTRVYSEGKDDEGVWEWPGGNDSPENVYHDGIRALEHGVEFNLFPLAQFADRGHKLELVGSETIRDKDYFVLKITLLDGFETYTYVNADTWLIDLSRDFRAFHPGVDKAKKNIETRYDQWKRADGIVFATRSQNVDLETGAIIAKSLVLDSSYNIDLDELDLERGYVPVSAPTPPLHIVDANESSATGVDSRINETLTRLAKASSDGASGILRITHRGDVLLESGFGSASCTTDEQVTPAHVFMIGSITKEFTRVLGFVLEEKGVLSLDDKLSNFLPKIDGVAGQVSLRQLMDHVAGLPDIIDQDGRPIPYAVEYDYEVVGRDELIDRAALAELISEPGQNEEYSNLGYQLLAAVYEVAADDTYPNLLRRYVYGPAGIEDTDFWFTDAQRRPIADGCRAGNVHWGNPIDDRMWGEYGPSWNLIGAGGLLSTAESLGRFFEGIGAGVYFDDSAQAEKYKASRMVFSPGRQQRVMGPAGSNGIFNAVGYWADKDRFNVILMTNRADHPAEGGLFREIIALFPPDSFATGDKQ